MEHNNETKTGHGGFLSFDPTVLLRDVLRRWLLILLVAVVAGTGAYILTDRSYSPVYRTSLTFVVTDRSSSANVYTNLTTTNSLATVFSELLNSSLLRKSILAETGETSFDGSIEATVIPETNLITVTVSASRPRTAYLVALAIIEHHEDVTYQVVDDVTLEVLQTPSVPYAPSNPANANASMKKMALLGGAGTFLLLLVHSYLQDKVRSGREAQRKLDCSYLGEIPHENKYKTLRAKLQRKKTSILITSPLTSFRFRESVRKLSRRVDRFLRGGKVLMVTSLMENEGKSTVAVNLALSMAQKRSRVLLIDCDLRKPACYKLLNEEVPVDLRSVLNGSGKLENAVFQSKQGRLHLLLEQQRCRNAVDLLSSGQMADLIDWARANYDLVILDLPPMAAITDVESVMDLADASLLVVRHNTATAPVLNKAIAALDRGGPRLLGCVLNGVYSSRLTSGQSAYGYGKYGKYGQYDGYGPKK